MARIFFALALFAVALLAVNFYLGLRVGDGSAPMARYSAALQQRDASLSGGASDEQRTAARRALMDAAADLRPYKQRKTLHVLFGVAASLVTMLVNGVSVTYFVGTSRWCREVVETYGLDSSLAERSARLKRRTFPWAAAGMLTIVAVAALGAASDPAATREAAANWITLHFTCAILGTAFIAWSFLVQVGNVGANYELMEEILAAVQRVRAERGLDSE